MVNWDKVKTELTEKDELVICSSESSRSHYESSSIALLLPNGEVSEPITVKASTYAGCLCVAIDHTLILFDCALKEVVQCISFDFDIDGYCMVKNNTVLVVALRNGYLHCFLVGRDQKLSERKVDNQDSETLPTFVGLHALSDDLLILVGRKGKVFRIPVVMLHTLNESFNDVDNERQIEFLWDLKSEVWCSCLSRSVDGSPVLMLGSSCNFYLSNDLCKLKTVFNVDVEEKHSKILSNKSASLIIGLKEQKLMLYCSITLICLKVFDEAKVLDFTVVDDLENEDLLLVSLLDKAGQNVMKLLAASDFSCKLQFKPHHPFIVDFPLQRDTLIVLDGIIKDANKGGLIDAVMVKSIEESNPENRLTQLLRRKLFQEAERFAAQYGLDFQEIYKAQSLHCMESMQHMNKFSEYSHLISLLDKIEDVDFIVNFTLNLTLADLSAFKSLLLYCVEKLQVYEDKENKFNMLMQDVSQRLHLLDTFTMLWQPNDNESWTSFSKGNILESFSKSLFKGEWLEAWLIWERHSDQCVQELDAMEQVVLILEKLPPGVFPQDLFSILAVFVRKVISHFPDASAAIVPWVISKIISLERLENWPKDALDFGEHMLSYLNCSDKYSDNSIILIKQFAPFELKFNCDSLQSLYNVIESLKDIQYFDSEFSVKIKLSDCDHEKKESLADMLLWKVHLNDYDKLLSGFLVKYLAQHQLSLDHVIMNNIEDMLSSLSPYWSSDNEIHLEKAVALIEYIKDIQIKGNCILLIMDASPVPWNITVSTLVNYGVMLDHPIAETIRLRLNLINIKSVLKKYDLDKCHMIDDFRMIIGHIIQREGSDMVQDCLSIALSEEKKEEVYSRCSRHYIQKREFEKAFLILEPLPKQTFLTILERIVHGLHADSLINGRYNNNKDYINILKLIELHFEDVLIELDEGQYILKEISLKKLSGYYFLKENFNLQLLLDEVELSSSDIDLIVSKLAVKYDGSDSNNGIMIKVKQLSLVFGWSVEAILIYMLRKNAKDAVLFNVIRQLSYSLIEDYGGKVDFLRWILSAILGQILNDELGQILQRILCRSVTRCISRDLPIVLEICRLLRIWLRTEGVPVIKSTRHSSQTLPCFLPISHDIVHAGHSRREEILPPLELLSGIAKLESQRQLWVDIVSKKSPSVPLYYSGHKKSITASSLLGEHYQGIWLKFQAESLITWSSAIQCHSENAKSSIKTLLRRLESSEQYDLVMLIGLLLCFDEPFPVTWINRSISRCTAEFDCMQLHPVLAIMFCDVCDFPEKIQEYEITYHSCLVEKRLIELGMSIRDTESSQMHKMKKIMRLKKITAENLEEFCFLLHLEIKTVFLNYMQHLLLSWTPNFSVNIRQNGREEYIVLNSVDHIMKTFNFISPRIKKEDMDTFLQDIWKKVNFYYYEVYEVILEIMLSYNLNLRFVMEQKEMIRFLKPYHRNSLPSPTELDAFGDMRTLPEISKWRLPLLTACGQCMDPTLMPLTASPSFAGSLIAAEVNFRNYSEWLEAPPIDGFNANAICIMAIKNEVNRHLKEYENKVEWQVYPSEEIFLQNVKDCTMQIENLQMATAIVYYIIPKLPPGMDQLVAAEMCLALAKKWVGTGKELEEAKSALGKIERKYLNLTVMQILYQNGFGQPTYLEMIDNPIELITSLYYNSTDFWSTNMEVKGHGVNCAAEQIAHLFCIELVKLKLKLISTWLLLKEEKSFVLNYSFVDGKLIADERDVYSFAKSDDMRRLFHICKSVDKNEMMNHLVSMAFSHSEDNISLPNIVKLRVILCMCEVDYDCAAEQTALRGIMNLRTYIMKLFLLIPLERIGVVHSLEEFDSLDMLCLARNILQKDPMKHANIALAAKFCLTMGIFHHLLWEEILKSMVLSSMHQVLVEILPLLGHHIPFIAIEIYRVAWKEALEAPFLKANIPMTSEDEQKCLNSLKIFHLCPVLTDVDFVGIAEHCLKRSKNEMATLVLPYLPSSSRSEFKKRILDTDSIEDITTRLQSLSQQLNVCISKGLTFLQ